jgi:hypothetical protein
MYNGKEAETSKRFRYIFRAGQILLKYNILMELNKLRLFGAKRQEVTDTDGKLSY